MGLVLTAFDSMPEVPMGNGSPTEGADEFEQHALWEPMETPAEDVVLEIDGCDIHDMG